MPRKNDPNASALAASGSNCFESASTPSGSSSTRLTRSIAPEANASATASQDRCSARPPSTSRPPTDVAKPASSEISSARAIRGG